MVKVKWDTIDRDKESQKEGINIEKKIELIQVKKQIEVLLTFLPDEILKTPLEELNLIKHYVGVLLFADVSGFTPLTEKYSKTGKGGIYRLTATLNAFIGAIVEVIYFFGGDVLKFSGDAFLALWKADPEVCLFEVIHEVITCALYIQKLLGTFKTEVNVLLKVKLAISCGNLTFSVIGDDQFKHYVILGPAINEVKAAEHVSVSGDVVVSPSAWGHVCEDSYDAVHAEGGNVKIRACFYKPSEREKRDYYARKLVEVRELCAKHTNLKNTLHAKKKFDELTLVDSKIVEQFVHSLPPRYTTKTAVQNWISHDIGPFIVKPVRDQVHDRQAVEYLTEMREVTIQFINIIPTTYEESKLITLVNNACQIVCDITSPLLAVVNKVSLFDKDAMILVLFGLRGVKHELESQNALKSGFQICAFIAELKFVKNVSVGITNGLAYCGVVGHPLRKEYTVIGGVVNQAARMMCAYEGKVTCDFKTYQNSKLSSSYFQLQRAVKMKGIENPGLIFEYNEDLEVMFQLSSKTLLLGRDAEIEFIRNIIFEHKDGYNGVLFKGMMKSGKSCLLKVCFEECEHTDHPTVFSSLCGSVSKPYFCITYLYNQLYDLHTKLDSSKVVKNKLYPQMWKFNEILQQGFSKTNSEEKKTKLYKIFHDLCRVDDKYPIVFIDNVQYIDKHSFELLDMALKENDLKLICTGCFDEEQWKTLWQFSLSNNFKILTLDPLEGADVLKLICNFIKVDGIQKKLFQLIVNTCEGRPGWIQSCLLKILNNEGIQIVFLIPNEHTEKMFMFSQLSDPNKTVKSVAHLKDISKGKSEDLTLAAISLDLFDSFPPYQQMIVKTAAVLGDVFTRSLLVVMLKYPNMQLLACAMKVLFEEEVFDCGSKYISSGGMYSKQLNCVCYMETEERKSNEFISDFPKYAFCKVLHFKNKMLRTVAYGLLASNQKKELHLRITDVLEYQNNACPTCLRDNSAAIINIKKFRELGTCFQTHNTVTDGDNSDRIDTNDVKKIIRDGVKQGEKLNKKSSEDIKYFTRKRWDPSNCFCLEILTRVYGDLIHHSEQAGHSAKNIFYTYQYGSILLLMDEVEDAIDILKEIAELCLSDVNTSTYETSKDFMRFLYAKVMTAIGEGYFRLGNYVAAKNYCSLCLRQFNIPMISTQFIIPFKIFTKRSPNFHKNDSKSPLKLQNCAGKCLTILTQILSAEGNWRLAQAVAAKSLNLISEKNVNVSLLCDVYSTAFDLYSALGRIHVCERLERSIGPMLVKLYADNITSDFFAIARLMCVLFQFKSKSGKLTEALKLGFRSYHLNYVLQAHIFQMETVPNFAYLMISTKRIPDSVQIMNVYKKMARKFSNDSEVVYTIFCLELILDTGFYLEDLSGVQKSMGEFLTKETDATLQNSLVLNLCTYYLRRFNWTQADECLKHYNPEITKKINFIYIRNNIRYLEILLLHLAKSIYLKDSPTENKTKVAREYLKKCFEISKSWTIFSPLINHYAAYYYKLRRRPFKSKKYFKISIEESKKQGNVLMECWTNLCGINWKKSSGENFLTPKWRGDSDWKLSGIYDLMQWSQIMYPLPIP